MGEHKNKKVNPSNIVGKTVYVKLSNCDDLMLCDKADWEILKKYNWFKDCEGYAMCNTRPRRFHRFIIKSSDDRKVVDHINRNRLDNRKCNLRLVSYQENVRNSGVKSTNKSGIKGVWYDKERNKWCAGISVNGKSISLGRHNSIEDACTARMMGEKKYWGINYDFK